MLGHLLTALRQHPTLERIAAALQAGQPLPAPQPIAGEPLHLLLPEAARLPVALALHARLQVPVVLVVDRADHALALLRAARLWAPQAPTFLFLDPSHLFYEEAPWDDRTRHERLQVLRALAASMLPGPKPPAPFVIAPARALMWRTLPRRLFLKHTLRLKPGAALSPVALARRAVQLGYQAVDTVVAPGQFAHRGGIVDLWPPGAPQPVRADFFGDEVDTLRAFDPATQRSTQPLEVALVTPAREFVRAARQVAPTGDGETEPTEALIPTLHPDATTLLGYLPPRALVLVDDWEAFRDTVAAQEEQAVRLAPSPAAPRPYATWDELREALPPARTLALGPTTITPPPKALARRFAPLPRFGGQLSAFVQHLRALVAQGQRVVVVSRQAGRLKELWGESTKRDGGAEGAEDWGALPPSPRGRGVGGEGLGAAPPSEGLVSGPKSGQAEPEGTAPSPRAETQTLGSGTVVFVSGGLPEGFRFVPGGAASPWNLFTDGEIFGWRPPRPRRRALPKAEAPEAAYADLKPGDWVVHVDFGIGRYAGLVRRTLEGQEREYLLVEYAEGDQLFVPVHQADRLTKYIGPDERPPTPTRLGTGEWQTVKARVRRAVEQVARDLLDLYARRQVAQGHAFGPDTDWQRELEASFPYEETEDQARAIAEVKRDMESPRPMDRLICGDVGYGKTEVALRAAFKAVMDGKQVAVLVPTTVLAQQHYHTFRRRLAAFPVEVEMLSRFRTEAEQRDILFRLANGAIDIIIGTHRLLSPDVQFKDLGLLIIDEEQRFGVTHKEHFKRLRTSVDVLTLTATPIPRTLYMALTGVRDISIINTPPQDRLPVITHVGPYDPDVVRQAILRELDRGGQVFFVHNRVQTIQAMRRHLERLVPEARIAVAHGQMPERQLAEVMERFAAGEVDVLLSTTIIESGLDFPNANTLIVDRADTFGLAQLYQLRGRVGRGVVQAYAYFFRHRRKPPTPEGRQRLQVLAEYSQLGAGLSIAMRDLEIRGAGELLGTRQHGHMAAVGFHLYTRLLAEAVRRLRKEQGLPPDPAAEALAYRPTVSVELPLAVGIPGAYIPDQRMRLAFYRRLAELRTLNEVEALAQELRDRFGPLPEMVENLLYQVRVRILAEKAGLASVGGEAGQIVLRYPRPAGEKGLSGPARALRPLPPPVRTGRWAYWLPYEDNPHWQEDLLRALEALQRMS